MDDRQHAKLRMYTSVETTLVVLLKGTPFYTECQAAREIIG